MINREKITQILRNVKALPTLPTVAVKLMEMGDDPEASMRDLARLVESDMSLATRVLKLVNSSYFGMRREVTSVQHALMILGTAQLRSLVLSGAVMDLFDREGTVGSFSRAEFWKHSLGVAAAAKALARASRVVDHEIAFTAGLIHDMGKVIVDRYLHEDFARIIALVDGEPLTMAEAEKQVLGVTHAEIGHHLAVYWNLPEILRESVGFHHHPEDALWNAPVAATVKAADRLARELEIGAGGGAHAPLDDETLKRAGLNRERFDALREDLKETLDAQVAMIASVA